MKKLNYDEALAKLRVIVAEIESNELSITELTKKVKEAKVLIQTCKDHLSVIQDEIDDIFTTNEEED